MSRGGASASGRITVMYISAKVDYAVRALCSLADADTALTAALCFDMFSIIGCSRRVGQGTAMRKKITGNAK